MNQGEPKLKNRNCDNNLKASLVYEGKKDKQEILQFSPSVELVETKCYGKIDDKEFTNILILGDNLNALSCLLRDNSVKGKIGLVYIDPPFSTNQVYKGSKDRTSTVSKSNNDNTVFEDLLKGSEYIEFIRERLIFLRELLSPKGVIYVHIDCKVGHYLKIIMDEIFGPDKFINDIARIKCNPKNFQRKAFGNIKDMILIYSKTKNYTWHESREELTEEDIRRLFPKIDFKGRRYATTPLHAPGETLNGPTGQPWRGMKPPKGRHWRYPPDELDKLDADGLIEWSSKGNPRKIIYANDVLGKGKKRQDIWEYKDPGSPVYPTEKNFEMLKMIIETSSNYGDIVMDCFSGSGTTLLAAEQTGRKWIGIDSSEFGINVTIERLRVIKDCSPYRVFSIKEKKLKAVM